MRAGDMLRGCLGPFPDTSSSECPKQAGEQGYPLKDSEGRPIAQTPRRETCPTSTNRQRQRIQSSGSMRGIHGEIADKPRLDSHPDIELRIQTVGHSAPFANHHEQR
jgi:hypothetical protein